MPRCSASDYYAYVSSSCGGLVRILLCWSRHFISITPDPLAVVGCQGTPTSVGFFYDMSTEQSYHECFSDPETSLTTPAVANELTEPVIEDVILLTTGKPASLTREYAVIVQGEYHGAYRIEVATTEGPPTMCTVSTAAWSWTAARHAAPTSAVFHFIAFGAAATDDGICFHACYRTGTG